MHFFDGQISLQCRQRNSCQTPRNLKITAIFFPLKTAQFGRLPFLPKIASFHYRNLSVFRKIITSANKISPENQWLENDITFLGPGQFPGYPMEKKKIPWFPGHPRGSIHWPPRQKPHLRKVSAFVHDQSDLDVFFRPTCGKTMKKSLTHENLWLVHRDPDFMAQIYFLI